MYTTMTNIWGNSRGKYGRRGAQRR
uniref:Uncharacterized protein n=1 Tax=Anguilla anguilla TaxID=7936 RepID=A0A0E9RA03_ANGAN